MDAETIRLIITAGVALVAGLGGATVTAVINRRNTLDTVDNARIVAETQLRHSEDRDHKSWLRGQKQEAYSAFMLSAQEIHQIVARSNFDASVMSSFEGIVTARSRIMLIGTPAVRLVARDIEKVLGELHFEHEMLYMLLQDNSERALEREERMSRNRRIDQGLERYYARRERFAKLMVEYVVQVRADLGTTTPDDKELDASNRRLVLTSEDLAAMDEKEKLSNPEDSALA